MELGLSLRSLGPFPHRREGLFVLVIAYPGKCCLFSLMHLTIIEPQYPAYFINDKGNDQYCIYAFPFNNVSMVSAPKMMANTAKNQVFLE
jgi:hypothetical protein